MVLILDHVREMPVAKDAELEEKHVVVRELFYRRDLGPPHVERVREAADLLHLLRRWLSRR